MLTKKSISTLSLQTIYKFNNQLNKIMNRVEIIIIKILFFSKKTVFCY